MIHQNGNRKSDRIGNPAEIPGAFEAENAPFTEYILDVQPGKVTLSTADKSVQKIFSLNNEELKVELAFSQLTSILIPVTLAPQNWATGSPMDAWLPPPVLRDNLWEWLPESGAGLTIHFENAKNVTSKSSLNSLQSLVMQENPNLAYPSGHYLTFPMAVVKTQGTHFNVIFQPR